jgi:hypothetical protein
VTGVILARFIAALVLLFALPAAAQTDSEAERTNRLVALFAEVCPIDETLGDTRAAFDRLGRWGFGEDTDFVISSHVPWAVRAPIRREGEEIEVLIGNHDVLCGIAFRPTDQVAFDAAVGAWFGVASELRTGESSTAQEVVWTVARDGTPYEVVSFTPRMLSDQQATAIRRLPLPQPPPKD